MVFTNCRQFKNFCALSGNYGEVFLEIALSNYFKINNTSQLIQKLMHNIIASELTNQAATLYTYLIFCKIYDSALRLTLLVILEDSDQKGYPQFIRTFILSIIFKS